MIKDQINIIGVGDKSSHCSLFFHTCYLDHDIYPPHQVCKKYFIDPIAWVRLDDSLQCYKVEVWDGVGEHNYHKLMTAPKIEFDVCLVMFSVVNFETFKNALNYWEAKVRNEARKQMQFLFVGTDIELREKMPEKGIPKAVAEEMIRKNGNTMYLECSTVTGQGVKNIYQECVKLVLQKQKVRPHYMSEHTTCQCPLI